MFGLLLLYRNLRLAFRKLRFPPRSTFITVLRPKLRRLGEDNAQISQTSLSGAAAPYFHVLGVVREFLPPSQTLNYGVWPNRANLLVFNATDIQRASQLL